MRLNVVFGPNGRRLFLRLGHRDLFNMDHQLMQNAEYLFVAVLHRGASLKSDFGARSIPGRMTHEIVVEPVTIPGGQPIVGTARPRFVNDP